jgi:F-type H+-transporting ATPase subunit delta
MAIDNNNAAESVDKVYAQALYEIAEQAGQTDAIGEELKDLGQLIQTQPDLAKLIDSRVLRAESLASAIQSIFEGKVSDTLYRFLQVLNRKGRIANLPGVIVEYKRLYEEKHGVVEVEAFVANRLDDSQASQVAAGVGKAIGRNVILKQHVDPSLIGGLKLRVGDRLIDGSAATQLKILRQRIVQEGREKARSIRETA